MVLIKILDPVHKIGIFVVGYHLAIGIFFQTIKIDEKTNVSIEFVFYTIIAINTIRSNELDFYLEIQFQWAQWSHLRMGQNATTIAHQTTFYEQFKNKNWALLLGSCMLLRLIWGVLTTDSSNNNKNTSTNNKSFGLIGFLVLMLNNYKDKLKLQWSYLSMSGKHKSKQQPNYKIVQKKNKNKKKFKDKSTIATSWTYWRLIKNAQKTKKVFSDQFIQLNSTCQLYWVLST